MSLDLDHLLTQKELAKLLKVTPKTIREWSLRGVGGRKLERVVLGGKVYYQRQDVEAFRQPATGKRK